MKIDIQESNEITAFLIGRLDTKASVECASSFEKLSEYAEKTITLDCSQLEYISSSGLRLFLALAKKEQSRWQSYKSDSPKGGCQGRVQVDRFL